MTTQLSAFNPSFNAYFNALIRELGPFVFHPAQNDSRSGHFTIPAGERSRLIIPCQHRSSAGRHILGSGAQLERDSQRTDLTFAEAVAWTLTLPAIQRIAPPTVREAFQERVLSSERNLRHLTKRRCQNLDQVFHDEHNFIASEQALIHGHSIHPCPKDRGNMSTSEALNYAPELQGRFALAWYSVDHRNLFSCQGGRESADSLVASLMARRSGQALAAHLPGHSLIPCHPFQHRHWQASRVMQKLQADGRVRFLGLGEPDWRATSSLRAIWSQHHDWMLKFSLTVRLTNSIRHLQPEEAVRGPGLARLLDREPLRAWLKDHPDFRILREPATLALCDDEGRPLPETTMVFRDNPFSGSKQDRCELLATLLQDDPRSGLSRLAQRLAMAGTPGLEWFHRYLEVAVAPLLEAQSRFGLLFGAHQQNLVLKLDHRQCPTMAWFRDCQGTGFTSQARRSLGRSVSALVQNGDNQPPDELGIRLFCYYLFINSTFNVITALAAANLAPESRLLDELRTWLGHKRRDCEGDPSALDYLLASPELHAKNNLLCCLRGLNENTLGDDIASIYHPMPNPLYHRNAFNTSNTEVSANEPASPQTQYQAI